MTAVGVDNPQPIVLPASGTWSSGTQLLYSVTQTRVGFSVTTVFEFPILLEVILHSVL